MNSILRRGLTAAAASGLGGVTYTVTPASTGSASTCVS